MNRIIRTKHILIIGIISLLASGIILSSNWSYFIRNNDSNNTALNSYQIKTNTFNTNYSEVKGSIIFQINILKSAISRNNFMYKSHNSIFKHNIDYTKVQKNKIQNKISIANSSIKREIDILNNMKNIIQNHPFNYLKFFQKLNYNLPSIVMKKNKNISSVISNIETYTSNIKRTTTDISNISYNSEEGLIGVKNIYSLMSDSKKLIFSKINFNYNSIFYFSKSLNNLTTLNKIGNTSNFLRSKNLNTSSKFIKTNNIIINDKTKKTTNPTSKKTNIVNYMKKEWYIFVPPLALLGLISSAYIVYAYKKAISKITVKSKSNNKSNARDSNVEGDTQSTNSTVTGYYDDHLTVTGSRVSTDESVDDVLYTDSPKIGSDGIEFTSEEDNPTLDINFVPIVIPKAQPLLNTTISGNDISLSTIDKALDNDSFFQNLYKNITNKDVLSYENFKIQVSNYLYLKKTKSLETYTGISEKSILQNVTNEVINKSTARKKGASIITDYDNQELIKHLANPIRAVNNDETVAKTTNGWFQVPNLGERLNSRSLSPEGRESVVIQLNKFKDLLESLPDTYKTPEYFSKLIFDGEEYLFTSYLRSYYSNENKLISNEILSDLRELIETHINHLTIDNAPDVYSENDLNSPENESEINSYYQNFEQTHLARKNFGEVDHSGTNSRNIAEELSKLISDVE